MIRKADLEERVREWGLREDVVEKDYVLGWLLWGIGAHPRLATAWVFKGGTCLKKCYLETYRFSEDLDFTVLPRGPLHAADVAPIVQQVLARVSDESGINFRGQAPTFKTHASGRYTEGRIYYQGPRNAPLVARIKLDLSDAEQVVRPTLLRRIAHAYPDHLPAPGTVRCYSFEELFAEKLRAMGERGRPRDLYDIVYLFRRPDLRAEPELIRAVLREKCESKGVPIPTFAALAAASTRPELESEWANMLAHQLPALPPFETSWAELEHLFAWLEGTLTLAELPALPRSAEEVETEAWTPPPTVWTWGAGVPLETIRFAAANHLCVRLGYDRSFRTIEPYSLRRTRDGHLLLHALRVDTRAHRSYRVERIQSVEVTTQPFRPVYQVEFTPSGVIVAPPTTHNPAPLRGATTVRRQHGWVYIIQCPTCQKQFRRTKRDLELNPHKNPLGSPCSARRGYLVSSRYQ
jgi:predicted nucleotidyltransferase component of viral defense system